MNELRIDPKWRWAAMHEGGKWYGYSIKPKLVDPFCAWVSNGVLVDLSAFNLNKHIDWRDSLHEIVHEDGRSFLRKHVDVPGDGDPVMVVFGGRWTPRYSAGRLDKDGAIVCYMNGASRWSSEGRVAAWDTWRRPTAEELEG